MVSFANGRAEQSTSIIHKRTQLLNIIGSSIPSFFPKQIKLGIKNTTVVTRRPLFEIIIILTERVAI